MTKTGIRFIIVTVWFNVDVVSFVLICCQLLCYNFKYCALLCIGNDWIYMDCHYVFKNVMGFLYIFITFGIQSMLLLVLIRSGRNIIVFYTKTLKFYTLGGRFRPVAISTANRNIRPNTRKGAHKNPTWNTQHPNKDHPKTHKDWITKAKTQQGCYKENMTATTGFTRKAENDQGLGKQHNTFQNSNNKQQSWERHPTSQWAIS